MNPKLKRLQEIHDELFTLANSLAGDETGCVAVTIHRSHGILNNAIRMLTTGITLEDEKEMFREHLKGQLFNRNKSEAEIEYMVEMLTANRRKAKA